ncbi:MAG: type II CRISPR-associated endonuclease Cas1 [Treponemataceae bacterium]|nr:type II CRISPR-associated endonuclease Cas1 [Treponemataceae bacterium]
MIPRILEVAENGRYIAKHQGSLIIKDRTGPQGSVPIDDVGVMMISAYGATMTKEVLVCLAERGAITVLCDSHCMPSAVVIPTAPNFEMPLRVKAQVEARLPLKKRLWQAIVIAKLVHQGRVLESVGKQVIARKLYHLSREVESGDIHNREAVGARFYWKNLFGEQFSRTKDGPWPNSALNYGYSILRSAVLRAIYGVGLLPLFSIHHENATNPFPLADDLMEPYRPVVDFLVYTEVLPQYSELSPDVKRIISQIVWADLFIKNKNTPMYQGIEQMCYSLVQSYKGKKCYLEIPEFRISHESA